MYAWTSYWKNETETENAKAEAAAIKAEVAAISVVSSSYSTIDILADVEATNLTNLTKEMVIIDNILEEKAP